MIGLGILFRLALPSAFPEIVADEGLWTNSSKNYHLFGDWFMDGRTHMLLSPVFHALTLVAYAAFGTGIAAARLVSGVAGVASIALLYVLIVRVSRSRELAVIAAILFAVNQWAILVSRVALIESVQLVFVLAAAVALTFPGSAGFAACVIAIALLLLTKVNAGFIMLVFAAFLLFPRMRGEATRYQQGWLAGGLAMAAAVGVAASVYYGLYRLYPEQFQSAYVYELEGAHFHSLSQPIISFGRFGIDPVQIGRSVVELFRESPFLLVLASIGFAIAIITRAAGTHLFVPWLLIGAGFMLSQMFQPIRYLYLVIPAFIYFAAISVQWLGKPTVEGISGRRIVYTVLAVAVMFDMAYVAMNALANRGRMLDELGQWAETTLSNGERTMAAGYLATDLPGRSYAHYHLARTPEELLRSIRDLDIAYVVYDQSEWTPVLRETLKANFPVAHSFSFGEVYRTDRKAAQQP